MGSILNDLVTTLTRQEYEHCQGAFCKDAKKEAENLISELEVYGFQNRGGGAKNWERLQL